MNKSANGHIQRLSQFDKLDTLVENRQVFTMERSELNIYETVMVAELVFLQFSTPCLTSMISGKKVMHLQNAEPFDFYPGESVVLGPGEIMKIDFPNASANNPTRCLALAISGEKIINVENILNEQYPKTESNDEWNLEPVNFHFTNDKKINRTLQRLIHIFTENHPAKKLFADYTLNELIIRLMQARARHLLLENCDVYSNTHRLAYAVKYINDHLHEPIDIETLCNKAYMSRATFFRNFKNEFGMTPIAYINQQRINLAKHYLNKTSISVTDVCYKSGFNNVNYFIKIFKNYTGTTPYLYKSENNSFAINSGNNHH